MSELSAEDKEHVRLLEEYRLEVQRELAKRRDRWWQLVEKIAIPVVLILVTAGMSGLLVPYVLRVGDDQRRQLELKSRLISEIVSDAAAAQMALIRYQEQLCDYWEASMGVEFKKRMLRLKYSEMNAQERQADYASLADDKQRENTCRVTVDREYAEGRARLAAAGNRLKHTVKLHYGDVSELAVYTTAVEKDFINADTLVNDTQQEMLRSIFTAAKAKLQTCGTEARCRQILTSAMSEIDKIRESAPTFDDWNATTEPLVAYVASHDPDVANKTAKAQVLDLGAKVPPKKP